MHGCASYQNATSVISNFYSYLNAAKFYMRSVVQKWKLRTAYVRPHKCEMDEVREVLKDETDCPFFKLGLIQALRYRKPQVR